MYHINRKLIFAMLKINKITKTAHHINRALTFVMLKIKH